MGQRINQLDLNVVPLETSSSLRVQAYESLKRAITEMDVYAQIEPIRLDERQLSQKLGVSRTPIREALTVLEQEGFVRAVPRRGIFVIRKSRKEICEMIVVWAALEGMAARLAATRATPRDISGLSRLFDTFEPGLFPEQVASYTEADIVFHQTLIKLSGCDLLSEMTRNLFIHIRGVRTAALAEENRAEVALREHLAIIDALKKRDAGLAEELVNSHTLKLTAYVERSALFPE